MSGEKRVTVTVDERAWQQAQQAAARLRDVNRELPGMLESLRRQQEAQAERVAAEIRSRQDEFDRALSGLSEQTRRLEADTTRRLQARAAMIRGELQEAVAQVRQDTRRALEDQERHFQEGLDKERAERKREFQALQDNITELRADHDRALAAATAVVADSRLMRDAIDSKLPHQRFAPGRLVALDRRLEAAESNLAQGLGEVALAQAQELYLQLGELRVEVELRDQEWQVTKLAASSALTVLQEQISVNANVDVTDQEGARVEDVTLDVDFWSEGELAELRAEAAALAGRVASEDDPLPLEDLRRIIEQDVTALDERLTEIVGRAQARLWASQVRANLAELVVTTLESTAGYAWEQGQALYAGGDQRRAFYSKLRHLDSSEIVVEVAPDESGESCVLRILSYDVGVPDEDERVQRAHAVADSLRAHGLDVGEPTAVMEPPDPALTDFERLRQPVAATPRRGGAGQRPERERA